MILSVLIPVYNERNTIVEILRRVTSVGLNIELVVVDDGSTDGTRDVLDTEVRETWPTAKIVFHDRNRGKGAAIRTAIAAATGDFVIVQDADLEYDPNDYSALLKPLLSNDADVVFGSRFLGGTHRVCFFWHRVANALLTNLSNITTNLNLTDMEVCYKAFRRDVIQSLLLRCNRFDFEPEVTAKVSRWRDPVTGKPVRVYEVPVSYYGRDYTEGKKIGLKDAFQAVWTIIRYARAD
jgi:glycosyltransferase involved in cell wall biosynthesis